MSIEAYRILKLELEEKPAFVINENEEIYEILSSSSCCSEVQIYHITKEFIKEAKKQAQEYETLEILVEIERQFLICEDEFIEYVCR